jgi:LysR family transcriptional regulator for bpeEF and oprC
MQREASSVGKLGAIETFVCVAESISFTAAAKKLKLTVSGVSRSISRLEEELQATLLNRTSRSISLTDEGATYYRRCKQILHDLQQAEHEITNARSGPRGQLRIQLPRALGKQVVVPALARFCIRYPEIRLEVILDGRSLNLEEEGIDVALRYGMAADSPLVGRKLCPVHYVACAAPSYLAEHGVPQSLDDISRHRLIGHVMSEDAAYRRWYFTKNGITRSIAVASIMNVNDMSSVADAASEGAGIAYLTDFVAAEHISAGRLQAVLVDHIFEGPPIYMAYARRRHASPRIRVLHDFLKDVLPPCPSWGRVVLAQKAADSPITSAAHS